MKRMEYDVIVVGCGIVGASLAYGLLGQKLKVLAIDGRDGDARAAKANFGLVGAQGKGHGAPDYQRLSRDSIDLWPSLVGNLREETGIDVEYQNRGCLKFCLSEDEFANHAQKLARLGAQAPDLSPSARMLERTELDALLPDTKLGEKVIGAGLGIHDGHCNPLKLLRALQQAIVQRGGSLRTNCPVTSISPVPGGGFRVYVDSSGRVVKFDADRIVIAAGLGSQTLGAMVGLDVPVHAQRGQVLVTERVGPLLRLPGSGVRQTVDGTVMIGVTNENVGVNLDTTTAGAAKMALRAIQILPDLARVRLVRHWACLRIMTPDGLPVYAESDEYPGAWIAICHSGITLAGYHAQHLAVAISNSGLPRQLDYFHHRRFNVSQAA